MGPENQKDLGKDSKSTKPQGGKKPKTKASSNDNEVSGNKTSSNMTSAKSPSTKDQSSTPVVASTNVLEGYMEKLREENNKLREENHKFLQEFMSSAMSKLHDEFRSEFRNASSSASVSNEGQVAHCSKAQTNKFDHVREDHESSHGDTILEVHAGDLSDLDDPDDRDRQERSGSHCSDEDVGIGSIAGTLLSDAQNPVDDVQWVSVLKQLPAYYDNLIEEDQEAQNHTSFVAKTFQKTQAKHKVPRLPLDGMMKEKWDSIEKYLKSGNVSPCTSQNSRRFAVSEEDFEKYGRVPKIDPEYSALIGSKSKANAQSSLSMSQKGTSGGIRDKDLRIAENEFQKCDESARVIFRAASHGALIVNAMHTIMNNPEKYQMDEALNLLHGAFMTFESIADCALRTTARSVLARRRIYLSQVTFKDSNAQKDLMQLPMDGKNLFHGEFSDMMHKYATMARDVRETSDYASSKFNPKKRGFQSSGSGGNFPQHKKPAFSKPQGQTAGSQGQSQGQLTIKQTGQNDRKVSFNNFKSPSPKTKTNKQAPFFKKGGGFRQ